MGFRHCALNIRRSNDSWPKANPNKMVVVVVFVAVVLFLLFLLLAVLRPLSQIPFLLHRSHSFTSGQKCTEPGYLRFEIQ